MKTCEGCGRENVWNDSVKWHGLWTLCTECKAGSVLGTKALPRTHTEKHAEIKAQNEEFIASYRR